jgi:hypothetical protein
MKEKKGYLSLTLGWPMLMAKMDLGTFSAHAQIMPSHYCLLPPPCEELRWKFLRIKLHRKFTDAF